MQSNNHPALCSQSPARHTAAVGRPPHKSRRWTRLSRDALLEAFGTLDEQLEPLPEPGDFPLTGPEGRRRPQ